MVTESLREEPKTKCPCFKYVALIVMSSQTDLLNERYGRKPVNASKSRARIIIAAASLLTLFLGWAIWVSIDTANQIKHQDQAFEIIDATQASVTFEITRPNGNAVVCAVQVLNQSYAVVGYKEVVIPASDQKIVATETKVNTTEKGVTGLVDKCWFQ